VQYCVSLAEQHGGDGPQDAIDTTAVESLLVSLPEDVTHEVYRQGMVNELRGFIGYGCVVEIVYSYSIVRRCTLCPAFA